jgi:flavin-dependent dehydrogenase
MNQNYDVCIFGAGPAGAATAARLANLGVATVVLERPPKEKPWGGESFTGAIREPLVALGLWEGFCAAGHVAGYEQRAAWGGAPWTKDSVFSHYGNLWHVDRDRFDRDMRDGLRNRDIPILEYASVEVLRRGGDTWQVRLDQCRQVSAKYLVDATGRARALARKLGARPRIYDRLIALTALIPRNRKFDHVMVVETTAEGWWYAAPVPQGHVIAYFTDSDLTPRQLTRSMRTVAANSVFTRAESRQGWLTVGDACAAHDPLCGCGVHRALDNGIRAADAIESYLQDGNVSLLDDYDRRCRDQFEIYLTGLIQHYSYEQRWAASPFWRRRASTLAPRPIG